MNHLEGHLLSPFFGQHEIKPNVSLVVSGGHTMTVLLRDVGDYQILGRTVDDAAGSCGGCSGMSPERRRVNTVCAGTHFEATMAKITTTWMTRKKATRINTIFPKVFMVPSASFRSASGPSGFSNCGPFRHYLPPKVKRELARISREKSPSPFSAITAPIG